MPFAFFLLSLLLTFTIGLTLSPSVSFLLRLLDSDEMAQPCSLLLLQDAQDNSADADAILASQILRPYYSIKYAYPSQGRMEAFVETANQLHLHLGSSSDHHKAKAVLEEEILSQTSLPFEFPITVSNYRKRSDPCVVSVLFVGDARGQFLHQLYNLLTPVYIPITRKDMDPFIFLSPPSILDSLLLSDDLPARIKFKLGVTHDPQSDLVVKTVCFFCLNGMPQILSFDSSSRNYFPDFVLNLNGHTLHVAAPLIRARVEADPPWEGVGNAKRGAWKSIFEEYLTLKFNFTYNIFISSGKDGRSGGGGTGYQLPNGTWIGVTGDLVSRKADLGIVTANTPKRIHFVDFTNSFVDFGYLTFVTAEGSRVFSPLALLWPLDMLMWGLMGVSTLVAFAFFAFIIRAIDWLDLGSSSSLNFARRGMVSSQVWTFQYQAQFVMTSFLDQDCVMPTFTPLRIFVAIWLFFTLVVTTIYRSKLVSLLAFPVIAKTPQDFDQLAYSDYKVGFMKHGDSAYNTLAASTDPVYVKLLAEMEIIIGTGLECLERVVKDKYGCIGYDFALRHLTVRNMSEAEGRRLVFVPGHTYNIFLGIATEGKSIYRINFGRWISYVRAFYLDEVWDARDLYYNVRLPKREWWFATNQSEKASVTAGLQDNDNLTLKHISGAFYVLIGLLIVCTVKFVLELMEDRGNKVKKGVVLSLHKKTRKILLSLDPDFGIEHQRQKSLILPREPS